MIAQRAKVLRLAFVLFWFAVISGSLIEVNGPFGFGVIWIGLLMMFANLLILIPSTASMDLDIFRYSLVDAMSTWTVVFLVAIKRRPRWS